MKFTIFGSQPFTIASGYSLPSTQRYTDLDGGPNRFNFKFPAQRSGSANPTVPPHPVFTALSRFTPATNRASVDESTPPGDGDVNLTFTLPAQLRTLGCSCSRTCPMRGWWTAGMVKSLFAGVTAKQKNEHNAPSARWSFCAAFPLLRQEKIFSGS